MATFMLRLTRRSQALYRLLRMIARQSRQPRISEMCDTMLAQERTFAHMLNARLRPAAA
jgi:hypothetical protein